MITLIELASSTWGTLLNHHCVRREGGIDDDDNISNVTV